MADHIVVGGGHNGLVTACYLARAGLDVLVLEQSAKLGGGSRTDELLPGYRFNTHSAAHNIINWRQGRPAFAPPLWAGHPDPAGHGG